MERKNSFASYMALYTVILFFVEFVRGAFLISFLPIYAVNQLGFSVATVGIAVSVHYIADTFIKCYAGYLLDRFSLRLIVQSGLLISFIGLMIMHNVGQLWLLLVASGLFGVGISPIWLVCLSKVRPEHRAEHMGLLYSFWLCGIGLGPVVINFIIDRSYTVAFWLMVGFWLIGWVTALFINNNREFTPAQIPIHDQISMLLERLRTMKSLLPGMILQTASAGILVPILPGFATKFLGLHYSQYSFLLIACGVCTVIFLVPMGKLSDRWGTKWFLILGFAAFSITLYTLSGASSLWKVLLLGGILGLSYACVLPAWNALLASHIRKGQEGIGWGLFSSVEGIGVVIGPILGGWIANVYNEKTAVWISSFLLGAIAIYYLILPPKKVNQKLKA
jgi:MFS family permease